MTEHRVTWQLDIEAESALEAARLARRLQLVPFTTAKVFDVSPSGSPPRHVERIDLCECDFVTPEPSDVLFEAIDAFRGLLDGETEVNGGDLVEFLTHRLRQLPNLDDLIAEARMGGGPKS